jgi:hypothetical protein
MAFPSDSRRLGAQALRPNREFAASPNMRRLAPLGKVLPIAALP